MIDVSDLQRWLRSKLSRVDTPLRLLELRHLVRGRQGDCVDSWTETDFRIVEADGSSDNVAQLAERVSDAAHKDARSLRRRQEYRLLPYFGASRAHEGRYAISVYENLAEEEEDRSETEPPTYDGALHLTMRLVESLAQRIEGMHASTVGTLSTALGSALARNSELESKRFAWIEMAEKSLSEQHLRNLASEVAMLDARNRGDVVQTIKALAPTVVNQLAGKKILPETISADQMMIREAIAQMDPASMEMWIKTVGMKNPALAIGLADMVERYAKEHEEQKKKEAADREKFAAMSVMQPKRSIGEAFGKKSA